MELQARCVCVVAMLLVASFAGLDTTHGTGECGRVPMDQAALKLAPCAAATQNPRAAVPPSGLRSYPIIILFVRTTAFS
jgi:hypothetical protein|uniref:Secreted protein n=2 Tax=Zea mays TaxID=4577 RepID=A0A804N381_MAIZE